GDGSGFDVLDQVETFPHVIFTTAFDQYAIDAFKYNSIDYLLKPVKKEELLNAIQKLEKMSPTNPSSSPDILLELRSQLTKKFKQKFLVKVGLKYHSYHVDDIAYFYSEEGETYLKAANGQSSIVDHTLDRIEKVVDPSTFFRINRHMIIKSDQISSIDSYFNNRLSLELEPSFHETIVVSRDRVKAFKQWMDE
ncbi:MAG: LytTR family DNA-binding domain-containing protein, partial [Bacteroidota bacterium]